jgi:cbb3-type cytochrome oxidase cytochrome c subunit
LNGTGGVLATELNEIGFRLQPGWVRTFLADPDKFGVPPGIMPGLLNPPPGVPQPEGNDIQALGRRIRVLSDFLSSLGTPRRKQLEEQFAQGHGAEGDAGRGRDLFVSFNCAACHLHPTMAARTNAAPDLSKEANSTRTEWLQSFLKSPHAIRPAGFEPGDGSRMPDFKLSDDETDQIIRELSALSSAQSHSSETATLSVFSQNKARTLLIGKLSCLGCHRLGEQGGRIGPDLSDVGQRRPADYIRDMVHDPQLRRPHTIMPKQRQNTSRPSDTTCRGRAWRRKVPPKSTERTVLSVMASKDGAMDSTLPSCRCGPPPMPTPST